MPLVLHHRPIGGILACLLAFAVASHAHAAPADETRVRLLIDDDWHFINGDPAGGTLNLSYNLRAGRAAAQAPAPAGASMKQWILPTGNAFRLNPSTAALRPAGNIGENVSYTTPAFNDAAWKQVDLPYDSAIEGPFTTAGGGGTGRLPTAGVSWYRKTLDIPSGDAGKSIFIDFDGAMSYSEVWLNGHFVGGWPYGYSSFRLNLTPYAKPGSKNILSVRLDNLPNSSRWYPGAGIYRNVWLVTTSPLHVGQWGTYLTTPTVSKDSATVSLKVKLDNDSAADATARVSTDIFELDGGDHKVGDAVASIPAVDLNVAGHASATADTKVDIANPKLWGTGLNQKPNRYVAVTTVKQDGAVVDSYETPFGIRTLKFDPNQGFFLNGEHIKINGVCDHHDLGALGAAVNGRALQRQLEMLADMGCNAIRTSHNPPAPELLDLADKMGFLVMDESFDCWERQKTANDYHLLFDDWHEQDQRAELLRDRNHPSIILWSIGNEVGEQGGDPNGIAKMLTQICHEEDPTRPTISAMNAARYNSPFSDPIDAIGLNYQGAGLNAVLRPPGTPEYPLYHQSAPNKLILGSETASTLSSRGFYTFPVAPAPGTAAAATAGEIRGVRQVSSYDMYFADWSYYPEKEFIAEAHNPFVAGEFVWTGFDYLGEPTPFDASRSSYFGIIDLAGFKKDRFYLYQSHWRPELPMAHILPHWTWPDRVGQNTPVMVYTSGDEAELFLNGKSLGRKKKELDQYRLRWDDVTYQPGELKVVAYKDGKQWATDSVKTAGAATRLLLSPDRAQIADDGKDLSFVTLSVADSDGNMVPRSMNSIQFSITGPGEIVATDNGDPTDMTAFPSTQRKAFNGLALAIVKARRGQAGSIVLTARSAGLQDANIMIAAK